MEHSAALAIFSAHDPSHLAVLAIGPAALDGVPAPGFQAAPTPAWDEPAAAEPFYLSLQDLAGGGDRRLRPYIRGGALVTFPFDADLGTDVNFDPAFGAMAAAGVESGGNTRFRGELQYMLRRSDASVFVGSPFTGFDTVDIDLTLHSLLVNGQAMFYANDAVSPYVGGGAGVSYGVVEVEIDGQSEDDSDTVPELQVMTGLVFRLRDNLAFDVGVSYTYAFHELESDAGSESAPIDVVSVTFALVWRL